MALKRATRVGQSITLPLLCDPDLDARLTAPGVAAYKAVLSTVPEDADDATQRAAIAAAECAREKAMEPIRAAIALFVQTLDPAALGVDLAGVTHVTIRGLGGDAFAECDEVALRKLAALPKDERSDAAMASLRSSELMRRGLVSVDGFDDLSATPYPVEKLAQQVGSIWTAMRWEIAARIEAWSHLGESAGSSSAPSCGEPMPAPEGAVSHTATAPATAGPSPTLRTTGA